MREHQSTHATLSEEEVVDLLAVFVTCWRDITEWPSTSRGSLVTRFQTFGGKVEVEEVFAVRCPTGQAGAAGETRGEGQDDTVAWAKGGYGGAYLFDWAESVE
jgi:hypothetical protein